MSNTNLLPFQPDAMTPAQLAAVSCMARYSGHTHRLYAYQLPHVELYIRILGETGLFPSSINTMMHGVRGFFRFAHFDGLIPADPAVHARLPKIHQDESRSQGSGPTGTDQVPADRAHHQRAPRRVGRSARHQRPAGFGGCRGADRALPRDVARTPGTAPGRQGQQARDHAADRPGPASARGLPRGTHRRTARVDTGFGETDRPPRLLSDGHPDREGGRDSETHHPPLAAPTPRSPSPSTLACHSEYAFLPPRMTRRLPYAGFVKTGDG